MNIKPFHESFIETLKIVQKRLSTNYTDKGGRVSNTFYARFRIETLALAELLEITTIPEKFISTMMTEITEISKSYNKEILPAVDKKEMLRIQEYFKRMLDGLSER